MPPKRKTGNVMKDEHYYEIHLEVLKWRKTTFAEWDPMLMPDGMYLQCFMSAATVDRVVNLALSGMITSAKTLCTEVDWVYITHYSESLFTLLNTIVPPANAPPPPVPQDIPPIREHNTRHAGVYKCSICKLPGHTSRLPYSMFDIAGLTLLSPEHRCPNLENMAPVQGSRVS